MAPRTDARVAPFVGVAGALVLLGAGAATWITEPVARAIGDVAVVEERATTGVELAPLTVVAALVGVAGGVGLLATRGRARDVVALLLSVAGLAGLLIVGAGLTRLAALDGAPTPAPWLALMGAGGVLAGGLLALRRPAPRLPARYDVDVTPADDEWRLASDPSDPGVADRAVGYASPSGATDRDDSEGEQP